MAVASIQVSETPLVLYALRRADDALILGHRLSEWCGHAPMLEEDMALANMGARSDRPGARALQLRGQGRRQGQRRGQVRLPARRQAVPQSAAAGAAERRFRPHHGAAVLLFGLRRSLLARDDDVERCDAGGDRGEVREGKRLSSAAFVGMDDPARRRHRGKPSPRAGRDRRSLGLHRRDVSGRRQRARPDRCRRRRRSRDAAGAVAEDRLRCRGRGDAGAAAKATGCSRAAAAAGTASISAICSANCSRLQRTFPGATW